MERPAAGLRPGALLAIAAIAASVAAAFAYTGGWLTPQRLTPDLMVDALGNRGGNPAGHRRNHAKGICFTGQFEANGAGVALSRAPMLVAGHYPVVGRFAIAVGDPLSPDSAGRVRSMAVRIVAPDGQEWRSGMNNMPVFVVRTPADFYQLTLAQAVDPKTGKPDPAAAQRFFAAHPESGAFLAWAKSAPWTASYAQESYHSLNSFRLSGARGQQHLVRWSMQQTVPVEAQTPEALKALGADFLEQDLKQRVAQGALRWHLYVTLAAAGDAVNDSTRAWPPDRERIDVGTLVVQQVQDEADGPCRDLNYDPTILPVGITPSDDPLLAARAAAYAESFDRRMEEHDAYPRRAASAGHTP
jgi:catalase